MWTIARRPRWIAALLLALGFAAGFAALGQWQLERSIEQATVEVRPTEKVVPLESIAEPQSPVTTAASGRRVSVTAERVPGDMVVLSDRSNSGRVGYWVVGHYVTAEGNSLAVAMGWTASETDARAAADSLAPGATSAPLTGRYLPSEAPQEGDFEKGALQYMSVAALINLWAEQPGPVYGGYLVAADAPQGLEAISSPPPDQSVSLNWLNLFYAVEWAVFAGFAVYLWWRLVRDAWERELEEHAEVN